MKGSDIGRGGRGRRSGGTVRNVFGSCEDVTRKREREEGYPV